MRATAFAVAAKLKDGTITSSPWVIPAATKAMWSAEVPELSAMHSLPATTDENSASKAATSGPCASMPLRITRSTALRSLRPMEGDAAGIMIVLLLRECFPKFV